MTAPALSVVILFGATPGEVRALLAAAQARMGPLGAETVIADRRRGDFAAAANAAARQARGGVLLFLEGLPVGDDWARVLLDAFDDPSVAAVGGRSIDMRGQAIGAGAILVPVSGQETGFALLPTPTLPASTPAPIACDLLARACIALRQSAFAQLGGFDEDFTDGDEVFDACLRLRERNLTIVEDPRIVARIASPTGPPPLDRDAKRRAFLQRWLPRAVPRPNDGCARWETVLRADGSTPTGRITVPLPKTVLLVHGPQPADAEAFSAALARTRVSAETILWAADGDGPSGSQRADAGTAAAEITEVRADRYVAFMSSAAPPPHNCLDHLVEAIEYDDGVVAAQLEGATLVALRLIPQHLRLDPSPPLDIALGDWIARAVAAGRSVRRVALTDFPQRPAPVSVPACPRPAREPFASIVMLSWNAPAYTEQAVASIARHTRLGHETIVIDNGSDAETRARLARLANVRVHYNDRNLGFALGCNQGAALATGTHVVWLNNDVVVTDGWLEALVGLQQRRGAVGISVPVSNNVHGHQRVAEAPIELAQLPAFAAERARRLRGRWYRADVAMGLCLCVAREVIDEIGGMDPRYAVGNFEDVDYCVRARAAGYEIGVCEDAFIHHFGSVSFRTNGIDYGGQTRANLEQFVRRWGVDPELPLSEAVLEPIRRGFVRATDAIPLPAVVS